MSYVKVNEVLAFVSNVGTKASSHHAVPCWGVFLVEFLLDIGRDVSFDVVSVKGLIGYVDRVLLHLLIHVRILDYCLSVGHIIIPNYFGLIPEAPTPPL